MLTERTNAVVQLRRQGDQRFHEIRRRERGRFELMEWEYEDASAFTADLAVLRTERGVKRFDEVTE